LQNVVRAEITAPVTSVTCDPSVHVALIGFPRRRTLSGIMSQSEDNYQKKRFGEVLKE
jgi:hypothetical protein